MINGHNHPLLSRGKMLRAGPALAQSHAHSSGVLAARDRRAQRVLDGLRERTMVLCSQHHDQNLDSIALCVIMLKLDRLPIMLSGSKYTDNRSTTTILYRHGASASAAAVEKLRRKRAEARPRRDEPSVEETYYVSAQHSHLASLFLLRTTGKDSRSASIEPTYRYAPSSKNSTQTEDTTLTPKTAAEEGKLLGSTQGQLSGTLSRGKCPVHKHIGGPISREAQGHTNISAKKKAGPRLALPDESGYKSIVSFTENLKDLMNVPQTCGNENKNEQNCIRQLHVPSALGHRNAKKKAKRATVVKKEPEKTRWEMPRIDKEKECCALRPTLGGMQWGLRLALADPGISLSGLMCYNDCA